MAPQAPTSDGTALNLYQEAVPWIGLILVSAAVVLVISPSVKASNRLRRTLPLLAVGLLLVSSGGPLFLNIRPTVASSVTPSPVKTVTYQSDFARGYTTGWFIQPGTSPSGTISLNLDAGSKVLSASANNAAGILVFYNGGEDWKNVTFAVTLKWINGSAFYVNFRDQMLVSNHSRYALQFDIGGGAIRLFKTIQPGNNPSTTTTLGSANYALALGVWYALGVTANAGSLSVSVNGATVVSVTDPTPLLFGTVGVENDDLYGAFRIGTVSVTATIPPQSTWQQLGGPDGGQIQAIDIDPFNTSIIYAGAVHTGVFKSDDKGDFWREIGFSNGMTGTKANAVAVAPSNSSIVYASLEDSSTGGGAYRSDDMGLHWRALSQGLTGYFVETLTVDPTNPNLIYLATENLAGSTHPVGLEKSTDGGGTWTSLLAAKVQSIAISKSNPNTIYLGTFDQGVMRSDNGGATWRSITPAQGQGQSFNRVVIDPQNPNIAIAHQGVLNLGGRTCGAFFRTTDGGNTWSVIEGGIPFFGSQPCPPAGGMIDIAQAATSTSTLYAVAAFSNGTGVMFRSDDAGSTWRVLNGRMSAMPQVVKIDPTDANTVYIGTFGEGVYRTSDGGTTLSHLTTGLLGGGVYALAIYPGNSNIIYASRSINGAGEYTNDLGTLAKSLDGGITWTDYAGPPYNIVDIAIDPVTPSIMYVATSGSLGSGTGVWKSTDGGNTWVQKNQGLTNLNLTSVAINPSNTNMILVGTGHRPYGGTAGSGIFKSTDGGNTWHKTNVPNYLVNRIVINPSSTNTMYAATYGGGIYKSTDAGENWSQANTGIGNDYVYALAVNPSQPDTLYAGVNPFYASATLPETSVTVFKTTNGGVSWKNILMDRDVEWILLDPMNPQNVYEGDHGGYISWSLDGGSTWSYGTDMVRKLGGHAYMWAAAADPGRDALLVGTCGRGVFINHLSTAETPSPIWLKFQYGGAPFSATLASNSSLLDFRFSTIAGALTFALSGTSGTRAVSNITIPTTLLTAPYKVAVDGATVTPISTTTVTSKNIAEIVVRYTQNGNTQQLVVSGRLQAVEVPLTLSYSVAGGGSGYSAPVLTYVSGGTQTTATLSTSYTTFSVDKGSAWSISDTLLGSSSNERWTTNQVVAGTMSIAQTASPVYYHQFRPSFTYSVGGGGSGYSPPTLSYSEFGSTLISSSWTGGSQTLWVDNGGAWRASSPLTGSTASERWAAETASGIVSSAVPLSIEYAHQYYVTLMPDSPTAGSVIPATNWFDAGSLVSMTAKAAPAWQFIRWDGTGLGSYSGTNQTASMVVNGPIHEIAVFGQAAVPEFPLSTLPLVLVLVMLIAFGLMRKKMKGLTISKR